MQIDKEFIRRKCKKEKEKDECCFTKMRLVFKKPNKCYLETLQRKSVSCVVLCWCLFSSSFSSLSPLSFPLLPLTYHLHLILSFFSFSFPSSFSIASIVILLCSFFHLHCTLFLLLLLLLLLHHHLYIRPDPSSLFFPLLSFFSPPTPPLPTFLSFPHALHIIIRFFSSSSLFVLLCFAFSSLSSSSPPLAFNVFLFYPFSFPCLLFPLSLFLVFAYILLSFVPPLPLLPSPFSLYFLSLPIISHFPFSILSFLLLFLSLCSVSLSPFHLFLLLFNLIWYSFILLYVIIYYLGNWIFRYYLFSFVLFLSFRVFISRWFFSVTFIFFLHLLPSFIISSPITSFSFCYASFLSFSSIPSIILLLFTSSSHSFSLSSLPSTYFYCPSFPPFPFFRVYLPPTHLPFPSPPLCLPPFPLLSHPI